MAMGKEFEGHVPLPLSPSQTLLSPALAARVSPPVSPRITGQTQPQAFAPNQGHHHHARQGSRLLHVPTRAQFHSDCAR